MDVILSNASHCTFCGFIAQLWTIFLRTHPEATKIPIRDVTVRMQKYRIPTYFPQRNGISSFSNQGLRCPALLGNIVFSVADGQNGVLPIDPEQRILLDKVDRNLERTPRLRSAEELQSGLLNYSLIKSWLHPPCTTSDCMSPRGAQPGLVLIDVAQRKLCTAPQGANYIALSYIWGNIDPYPGASLESRSADEHDSGMLLPQLPQTVEDALLITQRLGEQYLWVDAYCLNQHDPVVLSQQVKDMDAIYENAFLTIVAASGENSNTGITGVSKPLHPTEQPTVSTAAGDLNATFLKDFSAVYESCPLNKRAWTLQEAVLSTRLLFLTDHNYYMRCRCAVYLDILSGPATLQSKRQSYGDLFNITRFHFEGYSAAIQQYTSRKMSNPSDALNALAGLLHRIERKSKERFFLGLPESEFVNALLWTPVKNQPFFRRDGFPSWAWCGGVGEVEYKLPQDDLHEREDATILISGNRAKGASIYITSKMATIRGKAWGDPVQYLFDWVKEGNGNLFATVDRPHELDLGRFALHAIQLRRSDRHANVTCLLVQQGKESWSRVGVARFPEKMWNWWFWPKMTTITVE